MPPMNHKIDALQVLQSALDTRGEYGSSDAVDDKDAVLDAVEEALTASIKLRGWSERPDRAYWYEVDTVSPKHRAEDARGWTTVELKGWKERAGGADLREDYVFNLDEALAVAYRLITETWDAEEAAIWAVDDKNRCPSNPGAVTRCPRCATPTHFGESDDTGLCLNCALVVDAATHGECCTCPACAELRSRQ